MQAVEESTTTMPLWFDLQRLGVEAAEGAGYSGVADAIRDELGALVRRAPGIQNLTFRSGLAFADDQTRAWLATLAAPAAAPMGGGVGGDDKLAASVEAARAHLAKGKLDGALGALQEGAGDDRTARDRFRRRLQTAALCIQGGQPDVAAPLLEHLAAEADLHGLDQWEPTLAVELWVQVYTAAAGAAAGPVTPENEPARARRAAAYARVCALDAARALTLPPLS